MEKVACDVCSRRFKTADALSQHKSDKHSSKHDATVTKSKISTGKILAYAIPVLVIGLIGYGLFWALTASNTGMGAPGSTHTHQDFKMYINGNQIDFSQSKYQRPQNPYVHMEGGDGDVIHKHATGVVLRVFLKSVDINVDSNCLTMDTGEKYCNGDGKTLKLYINGKTSNNWDYDLQDLDKILVSYGNEPEDAIKQQLASITDKAKEESGKSDSQSGLYVR